MDPIIEVLALLLGFLGWVMVGIAIPNRYWKTSTVDGNVITTSTIYENLWMSCASDSTGVHNCREFPSLLALSGRPSKRSRLLMIASVVLGTIGLAATLIGMQCNIIFWDEQMNVMQSLCTMISVSWYAFNITQEFFNPLFPGTKYELGEGLYIGWCSGTLAICGGVCLVFACKSDTDEKPAYPYQPSRGTVYSAATSRRDAHSTYDKNAYV
uniref:Claudin n=1 Tax=Electrophorus electricus TaxID=8005 RepID=A0A4W4DZB3_ELEEL